MSRLGPVAATFVTRCGCTKRMMIPELLEEYRIPLYRSPTTIAEFNPNSPELVEIETRVFKLHSFRSNEYGHDAEYREQ